MNPLHQSILDKLQQAENLTAEQKDFLLKALKENDKNQTQIKFKLDRVEKDRRTLSVMLEESIEDLQKKNQELVIEGSLERVRAVAMGMNKLDDMLQVCQTIAQQLELLGVKEIRNVQTGIFYESKGTYTNYEFYAKHDKVLITEVDYNNHPVAKKFAEQMLKGPNEMFRQGFIGEEVRDWLNYQKTTNVFIDNYLETAPTLNYYWYSLGPVALGTSTYVPLSEEEINLFKRFRNVFELAYRRFLDIEQAIAQTREAQIELALERVRARTMAMQKSDELKVVVNLVYQQFEELKITNQSTDIEIGLINEETGVAAMWASAFNSNGEMEKFNLPLNDFPILKDEFKSYSRTPTNERKNLLISNTYQGKVWQRFLEVMAAQKRISDALQKTKQWVTHNAYFSHGFLTLQGKNVYQPGQVEVLVRFARLFEQTYTRFLDLQKAEAQARESQIELALERVRARTMAMQKSEELSETVFVLHQQFRELGEDPIQMTIGIYKEEQRVIEFHVTDWAGGGKQINNTFYLSIDEPTLLKKAFEGWRAKNKSMVVDLTGKELQGWLKYRSGVTGVKTRSKDTGGRRVVSIAFFSNGHISISSPEPRPAETIQLLERFANVFDLTYRRFTDLKNAEAQTREAKIEAALERVRSRAMAMHKTDELLDAAERLYHELIGLGITSLSVTYSIMAEDEKSALYYGINPLDGKIGPKPFVFLHTETEVMKAILRSWKNQEPVHTIELDEDGTLRHQTYVGQHILAWIKQHHLDMPFSVESFIEVSPKRAFINTFNFSQGYIFIIGGERLTTEQQQILLRFTKVFELTYRRFLDLQNAEAQAREAQIEAALEKVRSRSLAMHSSAELHDVITVVFEKLKELNVSLDVASIAIVFEDLKQVELWTAAPGQTYAYCFKIPFSDHAIFSDALDAFKKDLDFYSKSYSLEEKNSYYKFLFENTNLKNVPEDRKKFILSGERYSVCAAIEKAIAIQLVNYSGMPSTDSEIEILKRFVKVFSQAYTRFLDLQKAEAQAREAQIEASLERVRGSMMAMHQSDRLPEVMKVTFEQLLQLGISIDVVIFFPVSKDKDLTYWAATREQAYPVKVLLPYLDHPLFSLIQKSTEDGTDFSVITLSREENYSFYKQVIDHSNVGPLMSDQRKALVLSAPGQSVSMAFRKNSIISIHNLSAILFSDEENSILKRFSNVFEQAYTRFLDIQKAEAQAREAQIEAALERVRAKTMAMHKSDQLPVTAQVLFEQFAELGKIPDRIGIGIINEALQVIEWWVTDQQGSQVTRQFNASVLEPTNAKWYAAWKQDKDALEVDLSGEELKEWIAFVRDEVKMPIDDSKMKGRRVHHSAFFSQGLLLCSTHEPWAADTLQLLVRFAKVFSQTYTRFLDLEKAEAQAREAQIEVSLERVRASAMAMHTSEDVVNATSVLFDELHKLSVETLRCGIAIIEEDQTMEVWSVMIEERKTIRGIGHFNMNDHPTWRGLYKTWKEGEDFYAYYLADEDKRAYLKILTDTTNYLSEPLQEFPNAHFQCYNFKEGSVWAFSLNPYSEENKAVLKKFTAVFSLTFRRYQDLQKAEAQAREATLEAALEKVRGKAMAMHSSNDLSATASLVFTELRKIGINPIRCGVGLLVKESRRGQLYSAGENLALVGWVQLEGHSVLERIYDAWVDNEDYFPELSGEQIKSYYEKLLVGLALPSVPDWVSGQKQYGAFLPFSIGCLYTWSEVSYNADEIKILKRFALIIDLTFRRYIELQKSEAIAEEAIRQASLDRVRAEIASMRTTNDLDRITPLIWNELSVLGIPFVRCGVFIMDEQRELIHTFLSTPEGKAIVAFHLPFDTPGNFAEVVSHWRQKMNYVDHWSETEFISLADILVKQGAIATRQQYLSTLPKEGIHLHFLPFLQGMLYVGNNSRLQEDKLNLIQSVAEAFSTAYARYEDFTKLEAAKQQVEKTLVDLKQTQAQLVQSEKMASLGELTAGIAHEIQNPLNFVNNFSEVSNELIDEMVEEVKKGNYEDAKAIADDVKQNLEKINHHGKRADAIVKGMLQHSRSSTGTKEPTDINKLADEYLRLAYHGLRAKDKSFNAKFETALDSTIGNVNVIPQDIGRVILNLITNAFYAVTEKKKQTGDYEPTVTVTTKKEKGKVLISVKDNGNGIQPKVLDKIFQPFFTTKPTGQGTGLGLSLAYDIVTKGHSGSLEVETQEGEFTVFMITLNSD